MSNFSVNQVHQFYVAKSYNASVTNASNKGTIGNVKKIEGNFGDELYFLYKGADTVMKSDRIPLKNLDYVKAIPADKMAVPMKKVLVALDSNVNEGNPISGQDYILRINFRQFFSPGDDSQYFKDAVVHATAAMEASPLTFYQAMVNSLNVAFSREADATATTNPYLTFTASSSGITIEEKEQEWTLGVKKQRRVMFEVMPTTVFFSGDDVIWGTVTPQASTTLVGNGKQIADLEWFCAGECGDQYRMVGWPNYIHTEYLVDATKTYNVLEIHYAFTDSGVNSYRTEKDLTIVAEDAGVLNNVIGAINTAAGTNFATLETSSDEESSDTTEPGGSTTTEPETNESGNTESGTDNSGNTEQPSNP